MLSTRNCHRDYLSGRDKQVTKFMPRYDGPYCVNAANHGTSTYMLDLPASSRIFPTFHVSQLRPYHMNNNELFPGCAVARPEPVLTSKGTLEHRINQILDERRVGRGRQYLVRWDGFSCEDDEWLPCRMLKNCKALDIWEQRVVLKCGRV